MASSPENVRLDMDNATDTTESSSHPLPPYPSPHPHSFHPPPAQPQWPLPSYPSAPPPEYGQAVGGKAYEASSATGPYLYTTSQANQPQQIFLPPYSPANDGQAQQFVLIDGSPMRSGHQSQPSFLAHFMLSCCVFWCCGWMCGGIAFIVACKYRQRRYINLKSSTASKIHFSMAENIIRKSFQEHVLVL